MPQNLIEGHALSPVTARCFLTRHTSDPSKVIRATANSDIVGVSGQHTGGGPGHGVEVYGDGERLVSLILSPTASRRVRRGEHLKAAADGYAVPTELPTDDNESTDEVGAIVHEGGGPGQRIVVNVLCLSPNDP